MTHQGNKHVEQQDEGEHNVSDQKQVQQHPVLIAAVVIGNRLVIRVRERWSQKSGIERVMLY